MTEMMFGGPLCWHCGAKLPPNANLTECPSCKKSLTEWLGKPFLPEGIPQEAMSAAAMLIGQDRLQDQVVARIRREERKRCLKIIDDEIAHGKSLLGLLDQTGRPVFNDVTVAAGIAVLEYARRLIEGEKPPETK